MTTITDNFNRADGGVGGNWATSGLQIVSNQLGGNGSGTYAEENYTASSVISANYDVTIEYRSGSDGLVNLIARATAPYGSSRSGYILTADLAANTYKLAKSAAEVDTILIAATAWSALSVGDTITCRVSGSQIMVVRNGVYVNGVTDATYASIGHAGVGIYQPTGATQRVDNFSWSDLPISNLLLLGAQ